LARGAAYTTDFVDGHNKGFGRNYLLLLLSKDIVDESTLTLDSTTIKVHQHGSGLKKGSRRRSRGRLTTKVHAVVDGLGNPLRFILFSGNRNDICLAQTLLEPFDLQGKLILIVVIPSRAIAKHPRDIDRHIYNESHLIENLFLKFKNHRRFATRYEKALPLFLPLLTLLLLLFGYFDGLHTHSRPCF
jgi:transposase